MKAFYQITYGTEDQRKEVENWLTGLEYLSSEVKEKVITAWVTTWLNSSFEQLNQMVFSKLAPEYRLTDHVVEVVRYGIDLAKSASLQWQIEVNYEELVTILLLHDIDKPLLYTKVEEKVNASNYATQIQHGVLGALLLNELGFSENVISTVATHATNSPFHGSSFEAYVLHYADLFSADHALMLAGTQPFYQRHLK